MKARISNPATSVLGVMDALPVVSPILVTGGTGTLGRLVVARLRDAGCDVRVLSRRSREGGAGIQEDGDGIEFVTGDLATGEGIEAAVEGIEIIVHCAGSSKGDEDKARHLVRAASRAGARHAGTIIRFTLTLGGRRRTMTQEVSEPRPGRELVEAGGHERTTFTVEPEGTRARVRIDTVLEARGLESLLTRLVAPRLLRPLYADELERLERRARAQVAAAA